jgi:hypothetical protein
MTGGIEAAGDLATGAIWGRAVEPHAGEAHGETPHGLCLNCGTTLTGAYCHACGQPEHIHRTLSAIWHDLAHGVFHFEGKVWRTLPMLVTRPGELTRRYIAGERARFVSPLALFLFIIFLMFAILSIAGKHLEAPDLSPGTNKQVEQGIDETITANAQTFTKLSNDRAALIKAGKPTAAVDAELDRIRKTLDRLNEVKETGDTGFARAVAKAHTGWERLDEGIKKGAENPNLLLYKLQSNAYKFSWLLIPISLPFMWLLFPWHRRVHLYDHTVFITYSLSFMTLFFVSLSLAVAAGLPTVPTIWLTLLVPPFHIYRQLRGAYRIGRASAIVRTLLLLGFAFIAVSIFVTLLLGLGLVG